MNAKAKLNLLPTGIRYRVYTLAIVGMLLTPASVFAYRPDHGFLPPGTSTCDQHIPVTLGTPQNAAPIPDPLQGEFSHIFFHVEELADGLFYMTDGVYQALFLVDAAGIMVVDAPPSIGVNPLAPNQSVSLLDVIYSIPETQGKSIRKLVYSHSHFDHIGAASLIQDAFPNVRIIAHNETRKQLRRATGSTGALLPGAGTNPPPLPNLTFSRQRVVRVGQQVLKLSYRGPIHEPGNLFIFAPRQRVLMLVDVVFPGWSPFSDLALAEDVPRYLAAHDLLLEFDFDLFVGGHLGRLGNRADIEEARLYLQDMKTNALAGLTDPSLFAVFSIVPTNPLGAFTIYLDQVACRCANLTLDPATTPSGTNWLSRLGAADINTISHCWQIAEALRIDSSF